MQQPVFLKFSETLSDPLDFKKAVYVAKNNVIFYLSLSPFWFDFSTPTKDIVFFPKTQQTHFAILLVIGGYITKLF